MPALDDEAEDDRTSTTLEALRIDTDRMPTRHRRGDRAPRRRARSTRRASPRALDSGRLPPIPQELTFGDEDSAVQMLHEVIDGPFPRPQLTVEPPPFPLLVGAAARGVHGAAGALVGGAPRRPARRCCARARRATPATSSPPGKVRVTKAGVEVARARAGLVLRRVRGALRSAAPRVGEAIEPVELLEIRRELIDELVAAHPGVARTLRTFYRERLLQTLLATAPFFQQLSAEERATIAERFRPRRFGRGAQIIEEGAPGGGLYLILVGEVDVVRAGKDGDDRQAGHARRGQLLRRDVAARAAASRRRRCGRRA